MIELIKRRVCKACGAAVDSVVPPFQFVPARIKFECGADQWIDQPQNVAVANIGCMRRQIEQRDARIEALRHVLRVIELGHAPKGIHGSDGIIARAALDADEKEATR